MSDGSEVRQHGFDSAGRPLFMSDYLADWWEGVVDELGFRPTIVQGAWMSLAGGGAQASAGFHDKGGCLDIRTRDLTGAQIVAVVHATRLGGAASWLRDEAHGGFDPHIHLVLGSDFDLTLGAAAQFQNYIDGGDGLAGGDDPDYHLRPEPLVLTPPDHYLKGFYDMTPEEVRQIVREEVERFGENAYDLVKVKNPTNPDKGDPWKLGRYFVELWNRRSA